MIHALIWKEYREHRAIWLTLAVVSGAGLFGLSQLMSPDGFLGSRGSRESLLAVSVLFAWTYGLVCGAMLLANERESGTMTFLDILPARRIELWLVKCVFGLILLLSQIAVLIGFVIGLGIIGNTVQLLATLSSMLIFGLLAMSWSLLFSAVGDNVLNVIGFSFVGQIAGSFLAFIMLVPTAVVLSLLLKGRPDVGDSSKLFLIFVGLLALTAGPVLGSARLFTRLDRQRRLTARTALRKQTNISLGGGLVRLLWLSYTQVRSLALVVLTGSFLLGMLMPLLGPAIWPVLTLLLGVLCGVTVWSDEQMSASFRFLGDQRFPLGRVWIVKVGMRFALAVLAAFVLLLPSLVLVVIHQVEGHSQRERVPFFVEVFESSIVGPIVPVWAHLSIWLLYGFTAGHLCGMLFRKSFVAAVVALGSAGTLLCFWLPSLVGIGLHVWQVAGVPLVLLLAGWLLMPAWTADRLLTRHTITRLGVFLLAAVLWTAGGLWYRVVEVPEVPDAFNMPAFAAGIPSRDQEKNRAGMEMHAAWYEVEVLTRQLTTAQARIDRPLFPKMPEVNPANNGFHAEILQVLTQGWPADRPSDLGDKLDADFQKEWYGHLVKAADSPLGTVEDAKLLTFPPIHTGQWYLLPSLNQVLAVRGLQLQARGDHRAFVDSFRIGLALSRHVQNHAPPGLVLSGRSAESICFDALDRWLEKLPGHPELLENVRDILIQHRGQVPDETDILKTSHLIALNTLEQMPGNIVEVEIRRARGQQMIFNEVQRGEIDFAALLWRIPWEHERHKRILRVVFEGDDWQRRQTEWWGGYAWSSFYWPAHLVMRHETRITAAMYAALLKVSLRLYQAKNGRLPGALNQLVHAGCLPAIPLDPFNSERQFHYRVSRGRGEQSDRAVLWSCGEDHRDDGGQVAGNQRTATFPGEDLIYVVPFPPR